MTSPPIGTDEELIVRLRKYGHIEAADALLSRIAEVERLHEALDRLVGFLGQKRVKIVISDKLTDKGLVLGDARATLSQHGKVGSGSL